MSRILLLGGGHAHLMAAPMLGAASPAGDRAALVAPSRLLLYSGMMPGWLAGQYRFDECAIDLQRICEAAGVEWIEDQITDIDFGAREAIGERARYPFDLVSVNVGSANELGEGLGGDRVPTVLGAKPFARFVHDWESWLAGCADRPGARSLVVVGGGAAAIEIAFALARLAKVDVALRGSAVTLATTGARLLPGHSDSAAALALASLGRAGVQVRFAHRYRGVSAGAAHFDAQPALAADMLIVATGARAPAWLVEAARRDGVAQAADGGIAVRSDLRSTSHPAVFACGDCASVVDQAIPKSGVHALRQGPVLARNLLALSQGGDAVAMAARGAALELHRYRAARRTLALLNRCDGSAIGDWGPFGFAGAWVWRWKDRIDRRFMARFR